MTPDVDLVEVEAIDYFAGGALEGFFQVGSLRTPGGWRWSDADPNLLIHPQDHALCLRYDPPADRLTVSPELDAYLARVIPTPASKGRFWR